VILISDNIVTYTYTDSFTWSVLVTSSLTVKQSEKHFVSSYILFD